MKLVYISSGDVSVYESQVLELLTYLKNEIEEVILLQGYSSNIEKNVLLEKHSRHTPIKTIWFKSFHCYPLYENKWIDSIYKAIREICNINDIVLHVRNEYTGYLVKKTMQKYHLDIPMLIDIRGLVYEELKYQIHFLNGKNKYKFLLQKWYFKKIYKNLLQFAFLYCILSVVNISARRSSVNTSAQNQKKRYYEKNNDYSGRFLRWKMLPDCCSSDNLGGRS